MNHTLREKFRRVPLDHLWSKSFLSLSLSLTHFVTFWQPIRLTLSTLSCQTSCLFSRANIPTSTVQWTSPAQYKMEKKVVVTSKSEVVFLSYLRYDSKRKSCVRAPVNFWLLTSLLHTSKVYCTTVLQATQQQVLLSPSFSPSFLLPAL